MLLRTLQLLVVIFISTISFSQINLTLLGELPYAQSRGDCSDIWGYVDGLDNEYAIVGNETGTSVVDVSDPANPVEVFYTAGATTIWRDMKVWGTTAYITNEGGDGLKIIDLSNLPGPILPSDVYQYTGSTYDFTTAHNIFIDEVGRAFITGSDHTQTTTVILDIATDQLNPIELGVYDDYYMHDIYVRNDTLWGGAINDGFFVVVDVTDPLNCVTMATQFTPTTFSHNVWLSDDGNTLYTTDEISNAFIASYDVSDLSAIVELDRIQSSPGQNVIPHNTFVVGDYLVTSYYRDGITIHDATNPANLIEVGNYDTSPSFSGNGFNGAWGVYPYLPSGNILASDIENGVIVLGPTFSPGAYLEGNVVDAVTLNPLNTVQVDIVATVVSDNTNTLGDYVTGIGAAGTYDVTYSKLGYVTETIANVVLTTGNTTVVDVQLTPLPTFTLQGLVVDVNSNPIANAQISVSDAQFSTTVTTNGIGEFDITSFLEGPYDVSIGLWGYHTLCLPNEQYTIAGGPYIYELSEGYSDIFELDLGWSVSGNADTGDWERVDPNGTTYQGNDANAEDDSQDCGATAYITGNAGGQAGNDDVDNGTTVLTSPVFDLSTYNDAFISFERWFFNAGGQGTPNDSLVVELTNGTQTVMVDFSDNNEPSMGEWVYSEIRVSDYITATSSMQLKVRAMDLPSGHLVEGGFDNLLIWDSIVANNGIDEMAMDNNIHVYPIPFADEFTISLDETFESVRVEVIEMCSGKLIEVQEFNATNSVIMENDYTDGMFILRIYGNENLLAIRKVVKM
ncbi:MAG: choice-of-anchor B family protein [Crocinitomicaceae bacterium]|nr:choice-of-anchor B family protein [Crocinitomicaceae bacterium]